MKIQSVYIDGMHNAKGVRYGFDHVNYLFGDNGAGKSTVLQAIQLALLGYIPGFNKTNQATFTHAKGSVIEVQLVLVDGTDTYTIDRSFAKVRNSVISNCEVCKNGELLDDVDPGMFLGSVELPVFNFNEFLGSTPNTLKKWFQEFLPSNSESVDVYERLEADVKDIQGDYSELKSDVQKWLSQCKESDMSAKVSALNKYLKELDSLKKQQIADNQAAVSKLIFYDDFEDDMTEESRAAVIADLRSSVSRLRTLQSSINHNDFINSGIRSLQADLSAECISDDEDIKKLESELAAIRSEYETTSLQISESNTKLTVLQTEIDTKSKIISGRGICPYTHVECESIKSMVDKLQSEVDEAKTASDEIRSSIKVLSESRQAMLQNIGKLEDQISKKKSAYSQIELLKSQLHELPENVPADIEELIKTKESQIEELMEASSKALANKRYNELIDNFTKDKYKLELERQILKVWIATSGPNGLQSELMSNPLGNFETTFNTYIQKMFKEPDVVCAFNVSGKANSFSFGLKRGDKYIPYNNLSSGEKCLYILAFMTCIIENSDSRVQTVIIDDMIDHLDDTNAEFVMTALDAYSGCQYILAGVKKLKKMKGVTIKEIK